MTKAKSSKAPSEVSDASILTVRRVVADLEMKKTAGKLTPEVYKNAVATAKKAVGKDWSDLAEAIENYNPKGK